MTKEDFIDWMTKMGFDRHGGRAEAAAALGVTPETVRKLCNGAGRYDDRLLQLAMSAIASNLPPWSRDLNRVIMHVEIPVPGGEPLVQTYAMLQAETADQAEA